MQVYISGHVAQKPPPAATSPRLHSRTSATPARQFNFGQTSYRINTPYGTGFTYNLGIPQFRIRWASIKPQQPYRGPKKMTVRPYRTSTHYAVRGTYQSTIRYGSGIRYGFSK